LAQSYEVVIFESAILIWTVDGVASKNFENGNTYQTLEKVGSGGV